MADFGGFLDLYHLRGRLAHRHKKAAASDPMQAEGRRFLHEDAGCA
jgi:hypothetical protein